MAKHQEKVRNRHLEAYSWEKDEFLFKGHNQFLKERPILTKMAAIEVVKKASSTSQRVK